MTSVIPNPIKKWTLIGKYELASTESTSVSIGSYSEFLVQFGDKNSTQPYGGMTYTDVITGAHSKPSFCPIYGGQGYLGTVYIYQHAGTLTLRNQNRSATTLFYLYVR